MASTVPDQQSSAVAGLVKVLRRAHSGTGTVTLPAEVGDLFTPILSGRHAFDAELVEAVVTAYDSEDGSFCRRLDYRTFTLLCGILRLSVECQSQLRGYSMLAECLYQDANTIASERLSNNAFGTKLAVAGRNNMTTAFRRFLDSTRSDHARRACGFYVLTLLVGNSTNKEVMLERCLDEAWRSLGNIVLGQEGELLKLLAGSIIRELLTTGIAENFFWPVGDTPAVIVEDFPKGDTQSYQWMWGFHSYLEKSIPQGSMNDSREIAVFAHIIRLADVIFEMEDESAILVTVSKTLSIMIPANRTRNAVYLDIYFNSISNIKVSKSDTQSQRPSQQSQSQPMTACCLDIALSNHKGWSHLMNDKRCQGNSIAIIFDYMQDATVVNEALVAQRMVHASTVSPGQLETDVMELPTRAVLYQSKFLDISVNRQDTQPTIESPTNMDELTNIASDAITHMAENDIEDRITRTSNDVHIAPVDSTLSPNGGRLLSRRQIEGPIGVQNQAVTNAGINPVSQEVNISRPRTTRESLTQENSQGQTNDCVLSTSHGVQSKHTPQVSQASAMRTPGTSLAKQKAIDFDDLYDISPREPKVNHLSGTSQVPVLDKKDERQQAKKPKPIKTKLSKQLRDDNGHLAQLELSESFDQERPNAYKGKTAKKISVAGQAPSTRRLQKPQVASKAHGGSISTKALAQKRRASQMSYQIEENEHVEASDPRGKKYTLNRAPEASMVANSKNLPPKRKEAMPNNTSNSSRQRPKVPLRSAQVPRHPSASGAKNRHSNFEDDEVDWSEDLHVDDGSDFTQPAKIQTSKKRNQPVDSHKVKPSLAQAKVTLPMIPKTPQETQKPRRAAAVKASKKIQGLADPVGKNRPTVEGSTAEKIVLNTKSASRQTQPRAVKPSSSNKISNMVKGASTKQKNVLPFQSAIVRSAAQNVNPSTSPDSPADAANSKKHTMIHWGQSSKFKHIDAPQLAKDVSPLEQTVGMDDETRVRSTPTNDAPGPEVEGNPIVFEVDQAPKKAPKKAKPLLEHESNDHLPKGFGENNLISKQHTILGSARVLPIPQAQATTDSPHDQVYFPSDVLDGSVNIPSTSTSPQAQNEIISNHRGDNRDVLSSDLPDMPDVMNHGEVSNPAHRKPTPQANAHHHALAARGPLFPPGNSKLQPLQVQVGREGEVPLTATKMRLAATKLEATLSPVPALQIPNQELTTRSNFHTAEGRQTSREKRARLRSPADSANQRDPNGGTLKSKQKRRLEEADSRPTKKGRAAGWQTGLYVARAGIQLSTPNNKAPIVTRKPNLVHFDASGPKNQGTLFSKKTTTLAESIVPLVPSALGPEAAPTSKRKLLWATNGSPVAPGDRLNAKRRKLDHTNMQRASDENPGVQAKRPAVPSATGRVRLHGSQSSRVNEQGSPLPFHHSRKVSLLVPGDAAHAIKIVTTPSDLSNNEYFNFQDEASEMPEPRLPIAQHNALPPIAEPRATVASNTKHRPSSPNAPSSIITGLTAHRIQPGGHLIGLRTNEVVVPQNPQDPFIEATRYRPTSKFMEALRKSSTTERQGERANNNGNPENEDVTKKQNGNDPDKTLIGEATSQGEDGSSTATESSSSSRSSGLENEAEVDPSDDGSDPGEAWNKALRDDQRNIFDKLSEISHHLTQDLIDKETAIKDIIHDYQQQGNWILDKFEEQRRQELALRRAKIKKATTELLVSFQSVEEDCASRVRKSQKEMVEFQSQMEARQAKMDASVDAMLALCSQN